MLELMFLHSPLEIQLRRIRRQDRIAVYIVAGTVIEWKHLYTVAVWAGLILLPCTLYGVFLMADAGGLRD